MSASDYLLISAAVTAGILITAATVPRPEPKKEPPRESSRWKRFRIAAGAFHGALKEAALAVVEEPSGLKLLATPRDEAAGRRVRLAGPDGRPVVEIAPGRLLRWRRLRVFVEEREWLHITLPGPGEKKPGLRFLFPRDAYEVQGGVGAREYEVRRGGKLVASVSWQRPAGDDAPRREYVLETIKSEEALPLVALAAGLEAAMGPSK